MDCDLLSSTSMPPCLGIRKWHNGLRQVFLWGLGRFAVFFPSIYRLVGDCSKDCLQSKCVNGWGHKYTMKEDFML